MHTAYAYHPISQHIVWAIARHLCCATCRRAQLSGDAFFPQIFASESDERHDSQPLLTTKLPNSPSVSSPPTSLFGWLHRHSVRLLVPAIGATGLDDWPGGARQMMEAATAKLVP